jgi:hypothetical protein
MITATQYPSFQPAFRELIAISNSNPVIFTTSFNHNYLTGLIVRIDLPVTSGMVQIQGQYGPITVINQTQFSLPIDSTDYDPFIYHLLGPQFPFVVPFAEDTMQLYQAIRNVMPNNILP